MIVKHRRGTTKEWQEIDLVPEEGELVIEECRGHILKCKIGDGTRKFSALPYIDDEVCRKLLQEITDTKKDFEGRMANLESGPIKY